MASGDRVVCARAATMVDQHHGVCTAWHPRSNGKDFRRRPAHAGRGAADLALARSHRGGAMSDICQISVTTIGLLRPQATPHARNHPAWATTDHPCPVADRICKPEVTGSIPARSISSRETRFRRSGIAPYDPSLRRGRSLNASRFRGPHLLSPSRRQVSGVGQTPRPSRGSPGVATLGALRVGA